MWHTVASGHKELKDRTGPNQHSDYKAQVGLDWTHPQKTDQ